MQVFFLPSMGGEFIPVFSAKSLLMAQFCFQYYLAAHLNNIKGFRLVIFELSTTNFIYYSY